MMKNQVGVMNAKIDDILFELKEIKQILNLLDKKIDLYLKNEQNADNNNKELMQMFVNLLSNLKQ